MPYSFSLIRATRITRKSISRSTEPCNNSRLPQIFEIQLVSNSCVELTKLLRDPQSQITSLVYRKGTYLTTISKLISHAGMVTFCTQMMRAFRSKEKQNRKNLTESDKESRLGPSLKLFSHKQRYILSSHTETSMARS